jgi:predicted enzyme related to lactoylglutathione lyase
MPARPDRDSFEVGIVTRDGAALVAFYRDVLGFVPLDDIVAPGFCLIHRLRYGSSFLRVIVPEVAPTKDNAGGDFMADTGFRYLWLQIENLHETVAEARAFGCAVPVEPWEIRPGRLVCQIQDPDGNHIELVEVAPDAP